MHLYGVYGVEHDILMADILKFVAYMILEMCVWCRCKFPFHIEKTCLGDINRTSCIFSCGVEVYEKKSH